MTEQERHIVEGCLRGQIASQKKLYDTYSSKMFAVCLRYCKDEDDAKDQLQEGFIRVFQNLKAFKGEGSFEGWIRRIVINCCLESLRKSDKKLIHDDITEMDLELSVQPKFPAFDLQFVLKKIQSLAPGYRAVFNLYIVEGYQHHEIGEMLGISENTSKSQLSRARKILQDMLATELNSIHE